MTEGSLLNDFIAFSRDQLAVMERVIHRLQESPADSGPLNDLDEAILNLSNACEYLEKPAIAVTLQNLQAIPIRLRSSGKPLTRELHRGLLNLHECLRKLIDHLDSDYRLGAILEDGESVLPSPEDHPGTTAYYQFIISTRTDFANLLFLLKDLAEAGDQQALLVRCLAILENLHDAAASVSAKGLKEFYLRWASQLGELLDSCEAGNHISSLSYVDFVKKFPEVLSEDTDRLLEKRQLGETISREPGEVVIEEEPIEFLEVEEEKAEIFEAEVVEDEKVESPEAERVEEETFESSEAERVEEETFESPEAERVEEETFESPEAERVEEETFESSEAEKVAEEPIGSTEAEEQFYIVTGDIRKNLEVIREYCESFGDQQPRFKTIHYCGERIAALRSAFISCGSQGLAHYCTQWLQKTNKLGFSLKEGKKVDPRFMFNYLEQLLAVLPRDESEGEEAAGEISQPPEAERDEGDALNSELFHKLSASVNATMSNIAKTELSSFHDILEEMLEGGEDTSDENKYDGEALSAIVDELLEPNHDDD